MEQKTVYGLKAVNKPLSKKQKRATRAVKYALAGMLTSMVTAPFPAQVKDYITFSIGLALILVTSYEVFTGIEDAAPAAPAE